MFEVAKTQADDKRGIIVVLFGAILLWITRNPIMEILGLNEAEETDDEHTEPAQVTDTGEGKPEGEEANDQPND